MSEFWEWFAKSLKHVADRAYHRGWHDAEFNAQNPEAAWPGEDVQRAWYTDSGFDPEFVAGHYKSAPLPVTREDVLLLREVAATHAAESGEDWHEDVAPINDLADRIESLLPPEK